MKWALLSDIHANLHALQACMAHAREQGIDKWAILGDIVGYGGDPLPVVEAVMALHHEGAVVLQGNHDAMAVTPPQAEGSLGAVAAAWTYQQLPPACRRFLAHIPLTQRIEHMLTEGPHDVRVVILEGEAEVADQIVVMAAGKVEQVGKPLEL